MYIIKGMKPKNVYSLVSLCKLDDKASTLLNDKCQSYINKQKKALQKPLPQEIKDIFVSAFIEMKNGNGESITNVIDALDDEFYLGIIFDLIPFKDNTSLDDAKVQKAIMQILKSARTISASLYGIFLVGFIKKESLKPALKEVLTAYANHSMFALHVINKISSDEEYPQKYHEAYYELHGKNALNRVDFYFDFVNEYHNSIFYNLQKKKREFVSYEECESINKFTDSLKKEFIDLLNKYNCELYNYEEVERCIQDFDNFFRKNVDPKLVNDEFLTYLKENFDECQYISHLIMTILTRTYTHQGFKFAISATRIFNYMKENEKLYKFLENMVFIDDLAQYALYALQSHPRFQKICLKLAKKTKGIPLCQIIMYLDVNQKKNREFVFNLLNVPFIRQTVGTPLLNKYYCEEIFNDEDLDQDDVNFFINMLLGAVTNTQFGELIDIDNYTSIIRTIYGKCYDAYKELFHYLNAALLLYFENHKKVNNEVKEEMKKFILEIVNYEEEVTYIDCSLNSDSFDPDEIACMIESYSYYPETALVDAFHRRPTELVRFLNLILNYSEDDDVIHECLLHLDNELKVSPVRLNIKSSDSIKDVRDDDINESLKLMMIADCLIEVREYYPNLYHIGINYYASYVRLLFYRALEKLNEDVMIEDLTIFEEIETNLLYENVKVIIEKMKKILGLEKIAVS